MAGADVIERDAHTDALQRGDHLPRLGEIGDLFALGQFEHHLRQRDRRIAEHLAHVAHGVAIREQGGGEIEADLEARPRADRRAGIGTDAAHQMLRQLDDQAARFRQRNERSR